MRNEKNVLIILDGLQSLDTWQAYFNNPSPGTLGLLNAIQNIGQLIALPVCAIACDKFGRVAVLLFGAIIILVGTALQGAAQNSTYQLSTNNLPLLTRLKMECSLRLVE